MARGLSLRCGAGASGGSGFVGSAFVGGPAPGGLKAGLLVVATLAVLVSDGAKAVAQERVLGTDISYWNTGNNQSPGSAGISQANWNTAFTTGNRKFAWIRATRGGATGLGQTSGTPGGGSQETLTRRYDDPRFIQNITRATTAGMLAGAYHFGRPDIAGNTGTDEANHFIEMAGAFMRPGYMMPVFDLEAGSALGGSPLAQFSVDFSNRIYAATGIRPGIYINGNYSSILQGASASLRNQLAQPVGSSQPTVTGPAYPMLWNARYGMGSVPQDDPDYDINQIPVQTGSPQNNGSVNNTYYGPWNDYGNSQPWSFWQYASVASIPGFNAVDGGVDTNVSHGDIEYVRNYLIPAVWWNDASGDWSTQTNWNSGQPTIVPIASPGQATPFATGPLPAPRLPGAAGSGPASGQYDTVILERPSANITVTLTAGTHNIRKLYMREALDIVGGALTINYDPTYRPDTSADVLHGGPISAQFSGPVSLTGSGALSVHTLQVDAQRTFTVGSSGVLSINTINLMPHASASAIILLTGDVNFAPLANAAAIIKNGTGAGSSGRVDLDGATRTLNIGNGAAAIDLTISTPIINGGLVKAGPGTLALTGANVYASDTTVLAGTLRAGTAFLANAADVFLSTSTLLDLNFVGTDVIDSLFFDGISQLAGTWGAVGSMADHTSPLITGTGLLQVTTYIAPLPPPPGDFNEDGVVDAEDLVLWQTGFGTEGTATHQQGDADGDLDVDGADFLVWQQQLGSVQEATAVAGAAPEPAASSLFVVGLGALIVRLRQRYASLQHAPLPRRG